MLYDRSQRLADRARRGQQSASQFELAGGHLLACLGLRTKALH